MAATVQVVRKTGAGPGTPADVTGVTTRCKCADNGTVDTNNPVPIPAGGTNYAYWVTTRLKVTVTPAGTINALKWYTDGANGFGTGVTCKVAKASTGADAGYRIAIANAACGKQLTQANHTGLDAAVADCFGKTVGSPLALVGAISNPDTGEVGDHVVYQLEVADTAGPGATAEETFTFQYDET